MNDIINCRESKQIIKRTGKVIFYRTKKTEKITLISKNASMRPLGRFGVDGRHVVRGGGHMDKQGEKH